MTTRIETWNVSLTMRTLAIAFVLAFGASGSAMAASEEPSFTARVQRSQGIASDLMGATAKARIASEATSFIARVEMNQGIAPSRIARDDRMTSGATPADAVGPIGEGEATSFITRVKANQGIGPGRNRS